MLRLSGAHPAASSPVGSVNTGGIDPSGAIIGRLHASRQYGKMSRRPVRSPVNVNAQAPQLSLSETQNTGLAEPEPDPGLGLTVAAGH